jgi:hypothetical protein
MAESLIQGVATPTIGNSPLPFSYQGGQGPVLNIGFIPSMVMFSHATQSWHWVRGFGFGVVQTFASSPTAVATGGVLDILDGSGVASPNISTTTIAIGLVLGTSTVVSAGGTYRGIAIR